MPRLFRFSRTWFALLSLTLLFACEESGYRDRVVSSVSSVGGDAGLDGGATDAGMEEPPSPDLTCTKALASDSIAPRTSVLSTMQQQSAPQVFTRDLFNLFRSHCGGCHVDQGLGDLQVTLQNFTEKVDREALNRIRSDDEDELMPPRSGGGKPYSERPAGDPVVELAGLLEQWLAAGRPVDAFDAPGATDSTTDPYVMSRGLGMAMTNLGNCIPAAKSVATESERSIELDAMFEKATELPERLDQTDLISMDSAVLARYGVVAFAPAYNLWADNAKKLRLIRVPRGTSIRFDPKTQSFDLPANTRLYKTFYKRVIDHRGNTRYRKMETRVIVSRPDSETKEGAAKVESLFGTYVWNDAETEALLLRDPLRDGTPFRDRIITYLVDEQAAEQVLAQGPENLQAALESKGLSRTYGVPGSQRCVHCHMGAPNKSFVLGVTPLQLRRRPMGEGGITETSERDELNQLQRLIDYGIVSGMKTPDEVTPLEDTQGERKARNEQELLAQAYVYGNCAHCHNPRGFPSVVAPELRDVLDFWPSEKGGVFQFPLERVSPRIFRGDRRDQAIPYISPSLYDVPKVQGREDPTAKVISLSGCEPDRDGLRDRCFPYLLAPWRSLIYRNVDNPFSYAEDSAIFPHMPMDTAGYDCRVRQVLGSWMVSVPVNFKYRSFLNPTTGLQDSLAEYEFRPPFSDEPQPYVEVRPGEPGYKQASFAATSRLRQFKESPRYNDCPDPMQDVVDPKVVSGELVVPGPVTAWPMRDPEGKPIVDDAGVPRGTYSLAVPERAHFADTDLTQAPGDWFPRRSDWSSVLQDTSTQGGTNSDQEALVVQILRSMEINEDFRRKALDDVPFGLWKTKSECDLAEAKKVADIDPSLRPRWLADNPFLQGSEPLYFASPGAMVFSSICANCHGPRGDSQGRLAATIADMTGGQTRVANLRDGLFGPAGSAGDNIERVFGDKLSGDTTAEEWAARYTLWMGLGGTRRVIPPAALAVVGSTQVLGRSRIGITSVKDANMLSVARLLCQNVLERSFLDFDPKSGQPDYSKSALIPGNGDAEMWEWLCTYENPLPLVRVESKDGTAFAIPLSRLYRRDRYPSDRLVGDPARGFAPGVSADNPAPWCLDRPTSSSVQEKLSVTWATTLGITSEPPYCPESYVADPSNAFTAAERDRWTLRGALNAGLAVFLYLDALTRGDASPLVPYDRCEDLR